MKKGITVTISAILGAIVGAAGTSYLKKHKTNTAPEKIDKFRGYYNLLNEWLILKQSGKSLESYFIANEYNTIAIYGMGEVGLRLYEELKDSSICIRYAIDKNDTQTYPELDVLEIDDALEEVDVIVVSAIFAFDEIENELKKRVNYPIVSLDEVIYEV
ncbi:MAG: hypothetical protein K0S61_2039 [Anaerocolumna sp.]|jgi:hypothetical protein|nr:hypothetical protein [Anaerocolumna sp.]